MEIPVLEARSLTADWKSLDCSYNFGGDNYVAEYVTDRTTETRTHSFRVKLTDLENMSSGWHYSNDTLTVKNNPPIIGGYFDKISVFNDENTIVDLVSYSTDYENSPSEIFWSVVEYSPLSLFDVYQKNSTAVEIWPASEDITGFGEIRFKTTDKDRGESFKNVTVEIMNASDRPNISIILQSPRNGGIIGTTSLNLTWSVDNDKGIINYDVYLGDSENDLSMIYKKLDVNKVGISELTDGQTYYRKITAEAQGIPTIFESEVRYFAVQLGFIALHKIEMYFEPISISVKRGDSAIVGLTSINLGNVGEDILLEALGGLKGSVSMDGRVELGAGEERTVNNKIFAESKLELKTYNLTVEAVFSGERTTASMDVEITGEMKTNDEGKRVMSWIWFIIGAILILSIAGLLIFILLRKRKSTDDEEEVIEAEIEARAPTGITQADLELLSIGGSGKAEDVPFQGRLAEGSSFGKYEKRSEASLKYKLPSHKAYQHKSDTPRVTLPDLNVMSAAEEEQKALPQITVAMPVVAAKPVKNPPPPEVRKKVMDTEVPVASGFPTEDNGLVTPVPIKPLPPLVFKNADPPPSQESLPSWDLLPEESTRLK